jgi:hypothetical protein
LQTTPEAVLGGGLAAGTKPMVLGSHKTRHHHEQHHQQEKVATVHTLDASTFDIRVFGAVYSITQPADVEQKLIVNSQTGLVTFDGVNSTTINAQNSAGVTYVSWTTAANTYSITFSSVTDPNTAITTFSFTGTATSVSNGTIVPFAGMQYAPPTPASPFDIRTFGAVYDVTAPQSDVGTQLVVNPNDGLITYDGVNSTPDISTDKYGKTLVVWSTPGKNYSVAFTSTLQDSTFVPSFSGTVTSDGQGAQPFSGTQHVPAAGADPWVLSGKLTRS